MAKERLVGSYLIRFTERDERTLVQLRDLRTGEVLEFETWVAAWAYVDAAVGDGRDDERAGGAVPAGDDVQRR